MQTTSASPVSPSLSQPAAPSPRTETGQIAAHLRLVIARAARRLRTEASTGLGPSLGAALATIDRFGPLTPSGVADREGIQRPSATRLIARLEEEGLVARQQDPADGRSSLVSVTDAGREHLAAGRSRKDAFLADRLDRLDPEDRATLDRAADVLERLLADTADPAAAPRAAYDPSERPASERPASERPASERPASERPAAEHAQHPDHPDRNERR